MWKVVSASVVGTSHLALGMECQDAHAAAVLPDGSLLVAVADGAGSACRASEASTCAVSTAVDFLTRRMAAQHPAGPDGYRCLMYETVECVRSALMELSTRQETEQPLSDFATTLLVLLATETWASTIQIGDGAIVCRSPATGLSVLSEPPAGEYINETTFVTTPDYLEHAVYKLLPAQDLDGVVLLTDGMQLLALKYSDNSAHAPFFIPLLDFASHADATADELETFLRSGPVCQRTDDDKTLVLAVRV